MKCAIMQPTYLPWSGYFNLAASVDVFVFLDDVQFEHQSWQTRNRVLVQGKPHLLVVPVQRSPLSTPISATRVAPVDGWRVRHERTLQAAYARHLHGREVFDVVFPILRDGEEDRLGAINRRLVEAFASALGLGTRFVRSSDLGCGGTRSAHLLEICAALGCEDYLSPVGARDYLEADRFEDNPRVRLQFQDFQPAAYPQRGSDEFVSHLSIVDVVANLGWRAARRYVTP